MPKSILKIRFNYYIMMMSEQPAELEHWETLAELCFWQMQRA